MGQTTHSLLDQHGLIAISALAASIAKNPKSPPASRSSKRRGNLSQGAGKRPNKKRLVRRLLGERSATTLAGGQLWREGRARDGGSHRDAGQMRWVILDFGELPRLGRRQ